MDTKTEAVTTGPMCRFGIAASSGPCRKQATVLARWGTSNEPFPLCTDHKKVAAASPVVRFEDLIL